MGLLTRVPFTWQLQKREDVLEMAHAYVILTAGKILDVLPINVMEDKPKKKQKMEKKESKHITGGTCFMCKEDKPSSDFYHQNAYCKLCNSIYQKWRRYDKKREKTDKENKDHIKDEFIQKQQQAYKESQLNRNASVWDWLPDRMDAYKCNTCEYQTDRPYNLRRHEETHHDDNTSDHDDSTTEDDSGISDTSFVDTDSDMSMETEGDAWGAIIQPAFEHLKDDFDTLVRDYEFQGIDKEDAESMAKQVLLPRYRQEVLEEYLDTIRWQRTMAKDPIHKKIRATATKLREEEDYEPEEAWQYALEKRKYLLDQRIKAFKPTEEEDSD